MVGFVVLSPLAYVVNAGLAISGAKPVAFCASCHVMHGYVEDLKNPDSEHLAAQPYQFRGIADHQCYTCHSEYGLFGDVQAKRAGLRHPEHEKHAAKIATSEQSCIGGNCHVSPHPKPAAEVEAPAPEPAHES